MVPLHPLRGGSAALQQELSNGSGFPPAQCTAEGSVPSCKQQLHSALPRTMPQQPRVHGRPRPAVYGADSKMAAGPGA